MIIHEHSLVLKEGATMDHVAILDPSAGDPMPAARLVLVFSDKPPDLKPDEIDTPPVLLWVNKTSRGAYSNMVKVKRKVLQMGSSPMLLLWDDAAIVGTASGGFVISAGECTWLPGAVLKFASAIAQAPINPADWSDALAWIGSKDSLAGFATKLRKGFGGRSSVTVSELRTARAYGFTQPPEVIDAITAPQHESRSTPWAAWEVLVESFPIPAALSQAGPNDKTVRDQRIIATSRAFREILGSVPSTVGQLISLATHLVDRDRDFSDRQEQIVHLMDADHHDVFILGKVPVDLRGDHGTPTNFAGDVFIVGYALRQMPSKGTLIWKKPSQPDGGDALFSGSKRGPQLGCLVLYVPVDPSDPFHRSYLDHNPPTVEAVESYFDTLSIPRVRRTQK